ncbi:MAG: ABC transporter substrate-binding protein, partial [Pseudomonadota bacterium]
KYTLRVRIKEADSNFLYIFATVQTAALAREAIEKYQPDPGAHPVGSGPFKLVEWRRSHKIVLEKNPQFREVVFNSPLTGDSKSDAIAATLNGKRLPLVDRIEVTIVEESQPRWLAFLGGETDYANVPADFVGSAFPGGTLAANLLGQGIRGERFIETDLVFMYFNLDDPTVGGKTPFALEKLALRRAVALGYNINEEINVIRNGGAARARSGIPPGVEGYDVNYQTDVNEYDPPRARALLDMVGYKDIDGDGFRESPDGLPLTLEIASQPDQLSSQFDQLWQKNMHAIGIRVKFKIAKWPDLNKDAKAGKNMMWQLAWSADYPDAENFLQNLYGPNAGQSNYSNFRHPQFDKLYEEARRMPASPERNQRYAEMNRIAAVYMPWIPQTHRYRNEVWQPWLVGYRKHPIYNQVWMYLDVDQSKRPVN